VYFIELWNCGGGESEREGEGGKDREEDSQIGKKSILALSSSPPGPGNQKVVLLSSIA
jgi:hypothetical protein